jgi:putative ABC transport system substrate-binding protein
MLLSRHTRRREFITLLGGSVIARPIAASAQQASKCVARVEIIDDAPTWDPFRQQLRELNYVEGQNILFEYRRAQGNLDRLQEAADQLARISVDVIAVFGTPAAQAAKRATKTVPIVAIFIGDPIAAGLISSFARPGGSQRDRP